ncbi:type II toxin-antitoxin system RelE/ParE family toxin [Sinorhizobium meliloti]|uniref:type II toxin-antitoxin system RelE/ParE family toxin n=1 Tax=Rhizobium meliloti TaxID=382 RepID=UPI000FD959A0|nr:type II toxin-antitoxin system RelE/ParE family toxin [Sinorhizobium meliloti]RVE85567.1 type II toxin-antitoxin system RelE/ParE family toxin [Sinorhizobium meliloti]RVH33186.1 type II toxin-antitoxin system RelE/ParE family toxin [Sinorhizobium meliloti]
MSRELVFTPAALADLEETFWFVAADNPRRARSYVAEIEQACRSLCETPLMGRGRPDLRSNLFIFPLWRRVLIAYELPDNRVDILRVFSGGQDYEAIMSGE